MNNWLTTYKTSLLIGFAIVLAGIHVAHQLKYQVNISQNTDDNVICLDEYAQYLDGDLSLAAYLLHRKNNHRTIVQRSLVHIGYLCTGQVNFKVLAFLANAGFLLFGLWFIWLHRTNRLAFLLPLLLFMTIAKNLTWFSAAAAYSYSLIFFYLIARLLTKSTSLINFVLALVLLPLLTVTFGNSIVGLFVLFLWSIYLLWMKKLGSLQLIIFIANLLLCVWIYFDGFDQVGTSNYNIMEIGPFALAFVGSMAKYAMIPGTWPAITLGLVGLGYMIFLIYKNQKDLETMLIFIFSLYLIGSGLAAGSGRCPSAFCNPLAYRYELFGVFFLVMMVLLVGKHVRKVGYALAVIILMLTVNKYRVNKNMLDIDRYKNEYIKREAIFTDTYKLSVLRKKWLDDNNTSMKSAQARGLTDFSVDLENFIPSHSFVNCENLTSVDPAIRKVLHKGNYSFIRGKLDTPTSEQYFLKSREGCLPITLHFDPRKERLGNFYAIVLRVEEDNMEILK